MRINPQIQLGIDQQLDAAIDFVEKKTLTLVRNIFSQIQPRNIFIGALFTSSLAFTTSDETDPLDLTKLSCIFVSSVLGSVLIDKVNI